MNPFVPHTRLALDSVDAAIFDMDGLLIDSEPLWKRAERESFAEVGIHISDEMAKVTAPMTTAEVAAHWFKYRPWKGPTTRDLEQRVISRVQSLVDELGETLPGVRDTLDACRARGWRTALASNSPLLLCQHVASTLRLSDSFDIILSSEQVDRGKPAPDIYLEAARLLLTSPARCLVLEDSASGVHAARTAGMTVVAIPSAGQVFGTESHPPHAVFHSLSAFRQAHLPHMPELGPTALD